MEENEQLQYKCPCCGGKIEFRSELQKLKCPYCDTEFDVETLKNYDSVLSSERPDEMEWEREGAEDGNTDENGMTVFVCDSCGGEIVCEATTAAMTCPYCDSPVIMTGRLSGKLKPDLVIPFKLGKEEAKKEFARHLNGKKLLPKVFKDENHIDSIKGIYVPFWLFDADADGHMTFRAQRTRMWSDSRYNYTETSHYSLIRDGHLTFAGVPADASLKMPDDLMQSIEPYDYSQAVDFQTAYLSGYLADRYDVDTEEVVPTVNSRIKTSTESAISRTVTGYTAVTKQSGSVSLSDHKANYALLPVWIMNTTWNGGQYLFAMNGQTGKFVGNLPVDKGAFTRWLIGLTLGVGAAAFAIINLIMTAAG